MSKRSENKNKSWKDKKRLEIQEVKQSHKTKQPKRKQMIYLEAPNK